MSKSEWIITLDGTVPIGKVRRALAELGFTVKQVLAEIDCLTGEGTEAVAQQARKLKGVSDVSRNTEVHLDPPDTGTA